MNKQWFILEVTMNLIMDWLFGYHLYYYNKYFDMLKAGNDDFRIHKKFYKHCIAIGKYYYKHNSIAYLKYVVEKDAIDHIARNVFALTYAFVRYKVVYTKAGSRYFADHHPEMYVDYDTLCKMESAFK